MLRTLIVAGLALTTLAPAEARGFRLSFRPRMPTARRVTIPYVATRESSADIVRQRPGDRLEAEQRATRTESVLDGEAMRSLPVTAATVAPAPNVKVAVPPAHWCDNGSVVGTGAGFCVLNIGAGAPS